MHPIMAYRGRLNSERVPFSVLMYIKRKVLQTLRYIKGWGKVSFGYLKGPSIKILPTRANHSCTI